MSKRARDDTIVTTRFCRKRGRDTEQYAPNKRFKCEQEVLEEAEEAVRMTDTNTTEIQELRRQNTYLRHMLGKVARLGISLKAERDYLLRAQTTHVPTQQLITVP